MEELRTAVVPARSFDDLASQAWSHELKRLDGWQVRAASGFSLRANSVLPTRYIGHNLATTIALVEAFYESRGVRPAFQMVPDTSPAELGVRLLTRGYSWGEAAEMWTGDPNRILAPRPGSAGISEHFPRRVTLDTVADSGWLSGWLEMIGAPPQRRHAARSILDCVAPDTRFASVLTPDAHLVGTAMGVLSDQMLGIFCVATSPKFRGDGIAKAAICELVGWAGQLGATTVYLQVVSDNTPARTMYSALGMQPLYRYGYLQAPLEKKVVRRPEAQLIFAAGQPFATTGVLPSDERWAG